MKDNFAVLTPLILANKAAGGWILKQNLDINNPDVLEEAINNYFAPYEEELEKKNGDERKQQFQFSIG